MPDEALGSALIIAESALEAVDVPKEINLALAVDAVLIEISFIALTLKKSILVENASTLPENTLIINVAVTKEESIGIGGIVVFENAPALAL